MKVMVIRALLASQRDIYMGTLAFPFVQMVHTLIKLPGVVELVILHARLASVLVQVHAIHALMVYITHQTIDAWVLAHPNTIQMQQIIDAMFAQLPVKTVLEVRSYAWIVSTTGSTLIQQILIARTASDRATHVLIRVITVPFAGGEHCRPALAHLQLASIVRYLGVTSAKPQQLASHVTLAMSFFPIRHAGYVPYRAQDVMERQPTNAQHVVRATIFTKTPLGITASHAILRALDVEGNPIWTASK
jgi:hypothetical protein